MIIHGLVAPLAPWLEGSCPTTTAQTPSSSFFFSPAAACSSYHTMRYNTHSSNQGGAGYELLFNLDALAVNGDNLIGQGEL